MKKLFVMVVVLFSLFLTVPALAQGFGDVGTGPYLGLEYGAATGLGQADIRLTIANIIVVALGVLGTLCVVLMVYAGFKWMTAAGNEDQAGEAKKIIMAAVIGLAIILSAYSITRFVMTSLFKATTSYDYYTVGDN